MADGSPCMILMVALQEVAAEVGETIQAACRSPTVPQTQPHRGLLRSGKRKEHKLKLFGLDVFWWGTGLPREWGGGQRGSVCPSSPG